MLLPVPPDWAAFAASAFCARAATSSARSAWSLRAFINATWRSCSRTSVLIAAPVCAARSFACSRLPISRCSLAATMPSALARSRKRSGESLLISADSGPSRPVR